MGSAVRIFSPSGKTRHRQNGSIRLPIVACDCGSSILEFVQTEPNETASFLCAKEQLESLANPQLQAFAFECHRLGPDLAAVQCYSKRPQYRLSGIHEVLVMPMSGEVDRSRYLSSAEIR